jgi:hypothetical protein
MVIEYLHAHLILPRFLRTLALVAVKSASIHCSKIGKMRANPDKHVTRLMV